MRAGLALLVASLLFLLGAASLALTLWLWFGEWPQQTKAIVDHHRSVAENTGRPPDPTLGHVFAREPRDLGGTWQAVIDPYARAELLGMAPLAREPQDPSDLGEFSFENGLTLEVPGDWNHQDPRLVFYQGIVWYKRTFEAAPRAGRRQLLWFGAANYRASVYLNGALLGEHEGGFTPFNFEATGELREGENLLVVKVDNRKTAEDVPTPLTDWHNYGGLTREVLLVDVPETFVRSFSLEMADDSGLADDSGPRLIGSVALEGPGRTGPVVVRIPELGVEATFQPDEAGRAALEVEARPQRWSPGTPRLYRVEVESGDDAVSDEVGFRTVSVRGDEILLNGAPVFLRGISIHEEAPREGGRAWSPEHARELLGWVRDLDANFVRLAHYPHSEHMARAADRLGILVWEEIPVYWNVAFGSDAALGRAKRQLSEVIERDRSRASVILWGIANETPDTEPRLRFLGALAEHVRGLDPSRLLTAAMLTGPEALGPFFLGYYLPAAVGVRRDPWLLRVEDPLGAVVDVPALNEYFGWYYSGALGTLWPFGSALARRIMLENMDRIRMLTPPGKPFVVSELGAGAKAGMHAPEEELAVYTEEYQALVYRRQLEMLSEQAGLAGMSPWILKDFRSPMRLYQGVQDHWNRKGLVADDGTRKLAFFVLRDHYRMLREREGPG